MPDDYYVSEYSGEEIDALLGGAGAGTVRYDAAQSLTDVQKAQARGNIGTAPDGFGLGGSAALLTPADNLDALMKSGWFQYDRHNPPQGTLPTALTPWAVLIRVSAAGNTCMQEAYDPTDSAFHGTVLRRTVYGLNAGAQIYPWEWVNPPMQLGVEYRTTERYLGKPVYVQAVNFGTLPNAATKSVTWATSGVVLAVLSVEATSNQGASLGLGASLSGTEITATTTTLYVKSSGDYSDNTAVFRVKYTKTTD